MGFHFTAFSLVRSNQAISERLRQIIQQSDQLYLQA